MREPKWCQWCGHPLSDDAETCGQCGVKVAKPLTLEPLPTFTRAPVDEEVENKRQTRAILATLVGAAVAIGLITVAEHSQDEPANDQTSVTAVPEHRSGADGEGTDVGEQVRTWLTVNEGVVTPVVLSIDAVQKASTPPEVVSACTQLAERVTAAQEASPVPVLELQRPWSSALTQLAAGAKDCIDGSNAQDPNLVAKGRSEITAGVTTLNEFTQPLAGY